MNKPYLILFLFILAACSFQPQLTLTNKNTLEYGSSWEALIEESDYDEISVVYKDDAQLTIQEKDLIIDKNYTLVFSVIKNNFNRTYTKTIQFTDTTPPNVEILNSKIILEYGCDFDSNEWFNDNFIIHDNYSPNDKLKILNIDNITSINEGIHAVEIMDEKNNKTTVNIEVILVDTTPPIISVEKDEFIIVENEKIPDFTQYAKAYDIKDKEVNVSVEPKIDKVKKGTYELYFIATDNEGNQSKFPFLLIVKEKVSLQNEAKHEIDIPIESTTTETPQPNQPQISEDWYALDQANLNACIAQGKESGSSNWECIPNGDTTYTLLRYD